MPDSSAPRPVASSPWLIVLAGAAAYGLFRAVGWSLLPPAVRADQTAGLLPALVTIAAAASLLRNQPRGAAWAFGLTLTILSAFAGLMRLLH